jgi:hypothetical protein
VNYAIDLCCIKQLYNFANVAQIIMSIADNAYTHFKTRLKMLYA